jgi:hypothetical protein
MSAIKEFLAAEVKMMAIAKAKAALPLPEVLRPWAEAVDAHDVAARRGPQNLQF